MVGLAVEKLFIGSHYTFSVQRIVLYDPEKVSPTLYAQKMSVSVSGI
jgi:hypothetical protein